MKFTALLFLLAFPFLLAAQYEESAEYAETTVSYNASMGYITAGSITYSQLRLVPELAINKFRFGLDVELLFTSDINVRSEDWDELEDIVSKIYYIKYAKKDEPFYFRIGAFPDYTIGHGLIMKRYNNRLMHPNQKNVGGVVGFNLDFPMQPGAEIFSANLLKNEILAAEAHIKPFTLSDKLTLSNLKISALAATDRNQFGKYQDGDEDKVPDVFDHNLIVRNFPYDLDGDGLYNSVVPNTSGQFQTTDPDMDGDGVLDSPLINSYVANHITLIDSSLANLLDNDINLLKRYGTADEVLIYGFGYDMPLLVTDNFVLENYGEFARINGYGSGYIFPGFFSKFLIFNINLELRRFQDKFMPAYFDRLYDEQRAAVIGDTIITTKDKSLDAVKSAIGWFGSVNVDIAHKLNLTVSYQDLYGNNATTGKSIMAKVALKPGFLLGVEEASVSYEQNNVQTFALNKLQTPSATLGCAVSYRLSDSTVLSGKYAERYSDMDGNGQIKGIKEIHRSLSLAVTFKMK